MALEPEFIKARKEFEAIRESEEPYLERRRDMTAWLLAFKLYYPESPSEHMEGIEAYSLLLTQKFALDQLDGER